MQMKLAKKGATTQTGKPLTNSDSLDEHLDWTLGGSKTLKRRLVEATSGHTDYMYDSREWSHTNDSASFPCRGRTGYAIDQSRVDVEEVGPSFMMAALICFPDSASRKG